MITDSEWNKLKVNTRVTVRYKGGEVNGTIWGVYYEPGSNPPKVERIELRGDYSGELSSAYRNDVLDIYSLEEVNQTISCLRKAFLEHKDDTAFLHPDDIAFLLRGDPNKRLKKTPKGIYEIDGKSIYSSFNVESKAVNFGFPVIKRYSLVTGASLPIKLTDTEILKAVANSVPASSYVNIGYTSLGFNERLSTFNCPVEIHSEVPPGHVLVTHVSWSKFALNYNDYINKYPYRLVDFSKCSNAESLKEELRLLNSKIESESQKAVSGDKLLTELNFDKTSIDRILHADSAFKYVFMNLKDIKKLESHPEYNATNKTIVSPSRLISIKESSFLPENFVLLHHSDIEPKRAEMDRYSGRLYKYPEAASLSPGETLKAYKLALPEIKTDANQVMDAFLGVSKAASDVVDSLTKATSNMISTTISKDLISGQMVADKIITTSSVVQHGLQFEDCVNVFKAVHEMAAHLNSRVSLYVVKYGHRPLSAKVADDFLESRKKSAVAPLRALMVAFNSALITQNSRAHRTACQIYLQDIEKLIGKVSEIDHEQLPMFEAYCDDIVFSVISRSNPVVNLDEMSNAVSQYRVLHGADLHPKLDTPDLIPGKVTFTGSGSVSSTDIKVTLNKPLGLHLDTEKLQTVLSTTVKIPFVIQSDVNGKVQMKVAGKVDMDKIVKKTLVEDVTETFDKAKWRVAQRQVIRRLRDAIILALTNLGNDRGEIKAIEKALKTQTGEGLLALAFGFIGGRIEFFTSNPKFSKLVDESKIEGMAMVGDDVIERVAGQMVPMVMGIVQSSIESLPEVNVEVKKKNRKLRIRKTDEDEEDAKAEAELLATELAAKEQAEVKQAVATAK